MSIFMTWVVFLIIVVTVLGVLRLIRMMGGTSGSHDFLSQPPDESHVHGLIGEKTVALKLRLKLSKEYVVLNDVYLPLPDGTTTQIDHIVVSPYGIFVLETKNYSGWIFAEAKSKVWTQTLYRRKSTFQNPIHQNYLHLCAIANNLGIAKDYLRGVVVFVGGCEFKTERPEGVVFAEGIVPYIQQFQQQIIKAEQVPEIVQVIAEWQGMLSAADKNAHVANLHRRHDGVAVDSQPTCPRCGGPMVLRTARSTGRQFWGCADYPRCRGIVNVAPTGDSEKESISRDA